MHGNETMRGATGGIVVCDQLGSEGSKHHLTLSAEFVALSPSVQGELAAGAIRFARWRENNRLWMSTDNTTPVDGGIEHHAMQGKTPRPRLAS